MPESLVEITFQARLKGVATKEGKTPEAPPSVVTFAASLSVEQAAAMHEVLAKPWVRLLLTQIEDQGVQMGLGDGAEEDDGGDDAAA